MQETGTLAHERWLAGAAAVAINAALLALLAGQLRVQDATPHAQPLQVVWIDAVSDAPDAPKSDAPESPGAPAPPTRPPVRAVSQPPRATPAPQHAATPPATPPDPDGARPLTAVLLRQVRDAAQPRADFAPWPLANRPVTVPGQPADTFRMREALTAARVLAGIGTFFGGSDYRADACPELHRQVAQLGLTDTPADRRHATELAQALCR